MPIYDQGYQRWKGEIAEHPVRWWPITRQGALQFLPQKKYLLLLGFAWVVVLIRGFQLFTYLRGREVTDRLSEALGGAISFDAGPEFYWKAIVGQLLWVVILTVMAGADLIAADRRHKALQLYFSKPITANDYIFGKLGVIAIFPVIAMWVPTMLLWLFGLMLEPSTVYFKEIWFVPLAATLWSAVVVAVAGMLMLAMSSIGQRAVFISVSWIIFFGYGPFQGVILLLEGITGNPHWGLISLESCLKQVGNWWFGLEPPWDFHPLFALFMLVGAVVACYALVRWKIKPVEVVL
jgi:ABC-type transport system involved in multi-copper enzyme maturation permease subunit